MKRFKILHIISSDRRIIMDNDTKDEIVYEVLSDIYSIEWQRTVSIENKAICIIGFVGILSVYGANLAFSCLSNISSNALALIIGFFCIIALCATFYTSIRALFYVNASILNKEYIMEEYTKRNVVVLPTICEHLDKIIGESNRFNDDRNRLLKMSVNTFLLSIALLSIFTVWCACYHPSSSNSICNNSNNASINMCIQTNQFKNRSASNSTIKTINDSLNNKTFIHKLIYINDFNLTPHKRY
jgi:hypothetical protein